MQAEKENRGASNGSAFENFWSDVHVHLQDPRFGNDLNAYFERARSRGVRRFVCAGCSPADWNRVAEIARTFPDVLPTFGVHPWSVGRMSGDWETCLKIVLDSAASRDGRFGAALGEVGLDFAVRKRNDVAQEETMRKQLEIAEERRLPVVVHSVRANERILKMLSEYSKIPVWLLHSWSATPAEIERAVDGNAFFSFSKKCVAPNAVRRIETVAAVPRDRILLESDGPNPLPPNGYDNTAASTFASMNVQLRDETGALRCEPAEIVETAAEICAIRAIAPDEFSRQLVLNERRFFQFWPQKNAVESVG